MTPRKKFDEENYMQIARKECFICNIVRGGERRAEHVIIDENEQFIAILNNYPTQAGQTLVCPKNHVRHIFQDLDDKTYQALFFYAKKIGLAIQTALNADRMYLASLGSNELNDHIHLHLFPLPANLLFEEQQFAALDHYKRGIVVLTQAEKEALADRIKQHIK